MNTNKLFDKLILLAIWATVETTETPISRLRSIYGGNPSSQIVGNELWMDYSPRVGLNYRLPNNTEPIHYDIELTTNVDTGDRNFTGQVDISLTIKEDTKSVVLHARDLEVYEATIRRADLAPSIKESLNTSFDDSREFLNLTLIDPDELLPRGSNWILSISFEGQLRIDGVGFHVLSYRDELDQPHYLATTNFQPTNARQAFPCFDEPAKRATFRVTINHSPLYNASSNMPINKTATRPGATVFDKSNVTISTYLVAFHVSDFVYSEDVNNSVHHRVYSKPGTIGDQKFGLQTGIHILQCLADYFKVDFPLRQIVQIALPGSGHSAENWGLVTHSEDNFLFNADSSTSRKRPYIAISIANAFCKQWLGNYVSIKWWSYLWLKEGFATLFSYQMTDEVYPEWNVYQLMHHDIYQWELILDGLSSTTPMTHYVQTPTEISYQSYFHGKAASVLFMWQHALGDEVFRLALNKYLTKNAFSSAEESQFLEATQAAIEERGVAIPARMNEMFPTWSQQSGYPLLTIRRNYESNSFTVTQNAFHYYKTYSLNKTFYVPFNYAFQSKSDFGNTTASHYLLNVKETTITDKELKPDDWLILNKQSTGYYRINYDERNWGLIANGLVQNPSRIHPHNRAQFLHDANTFVDMGYLNHSILLNLLTYLPGEDQYAPWVTAFNILTTYGEHLTDGDFKEFIVSIVANIYEKLGVNDILGEPILRKLTRNMVVDLACGAGIASCLVESNNKLKVIVTGAAVNGTNIEPQTYCNGLRRSSNEEFNYFFQQLMNSKDVTYRRTLITALGCSESKEQLKTFVGSSIDLSNNLTSAERTTILKSVFSRSSLGLLVSIEFLNDNWEAYEKLSSITQDTHLLSEDIVDISSYVNNDMQGQKLLALIDRVKESNQTELHIDRRVKWNLKANFDWLKSYGEPVMSWLKSYRKANGAVTEVIQI